MDTAHIPNIANINIVLFFLMIVLAMFFFIRLPHFFSLGLNNGQNTWVSINSDKRLNNSHEGRFAFCIDICLLSRSYRNLAGFMIFYTYYAIDQSEGGNGL